MEPVYLEIMDKARDALHASARMPTPETDAKSQSDPAEDTATGIAWRENTKYLTVTKRFTKYFAILTPTRQ